MWSRRQIIFLVLCALGFLSLLWSAADFFALMNGERIGHSFCSINSYWNCDRASTSPVGSWNGFPLGLLGALWFLSVAFLGLSKGKISKVFLRGLLISGLLASLFLFFYLLRLKTGCVICFFAYFCIWAASILGWKSATAKISEKTAFVSIALCAVVLAAYGFLARGTFESKFSEDEFQKWFQAKEEVPTVSPFQKGNPNGKITVVEFSDFGCPYCAFAAETLLPYLAQQPDVRIVYYPFPLDSSCNSDLTRMVHPHACDWARGAYCASEQGVLWEYHDRAFKIARSYGELPPLSEIWDEFHIPNSEAFKACLAKPETDQEIRKLIKVAIQLKIGSTPSFFIAGRRFEGFIPMPLLRRTLEELRKN